MASQRVQPTELELETVLAEIRALFQHISAPESRPLNTDDVLHRMPFILSVLQPVLSLDGKFGVWAEVLGFDNQNDAYEIIARSDHFGGVGDHEELKYQIRCLFFAAHAERRMQIQHPNLPLFNHRAVWRPFSEEILTECTKYEVDFPGLGPLLTGSNNYENVGPPWGFEQKGYFNVPASQRRLGYLPPEPLTPKTWDAWFSEPADPRFYNIGHPEHQRWGASFLKYQLKSNPLLDSPSGVQLGGPNGVSMAVAVLIKAARFCFSEPPPNVEDWLLTPRTTVVMYLKHAIGMLMTWIGQSYTSLSKNAAQRHRNTQVMPDFSIGQTPQASSRYPPLAEPAMLSLSHKSSGLPTAKMAHVSSSSGKRNLLGDKEPPSKRARSGDEFSSHPSGSEPTTAAESPIDVDDSEDESPVVMIPSKRIKPRMKAISTNGPPSPPRAPSPPAAYAPKSVRANPVASASEGLSGEEDTTPIEPEPSVRRLRTRSVSRAPEPPAPAAAEYQNLLANMWPDESSASASTSSSKPVVVKKEVKTAAKPGKKKGKGAK